MSEATGSNFGRKRPKEHDERDELHGSKRRSGLQHAEREFSGATAASSSRGGATSSGHSDVWLAGMYEVAYRESGRYVNPDDPHVVASGKALKKYKAALALCDDAPGESLDGSFSKVAASLKAAAASFAQMQKQRQAAGLSSNTRKQDKPEDAARLAAQHGTALDVALSSAAGPITYDTLLSIHLICTESMCPTAGQLRKGGVMAGSRRCCRPDLVAEQLDVTLNLIELIWQQPGVDVHAKAAAAMLGVSDVHPFADGNGRVSRILANMVLSRAGIPFTISLCSTQQQRDRYIQAVKSCFAGNTLAPMSSLIAEHTSRAWEELNKLHERLARESADEAKAATVRAARRDAAAQSCLICLEDAPNIATLCCGAACHLNCLADWLSSGSASTCVQCRAPLPAPPQRPPPPPQQPAAPAIAAPLQYMLGPWHAFPMFHPPPPDSAGDETSSVQGSGNDDTTTEDTTAIEGSVEEGDTTSASTRASRSASPSETRSDAHDDTTWSLSPGASSPYASPPYARPPSPRALLPNLPLPPPRRPPQLRCVNCPAQAARACVNGMCGRHCLLSGAYACQRHRPG